MKNLILATMLIAIGIALPIDASAKMDPIHMEKQRAINKANAAKTMRLRAGKKEKRFFDKAETKERTLKLDAIPPSPRRTAKAASKSSNSAAKPEHNPAP